jgi:hypothetical protein
MVIVDVTEPSVPVSVALVVMTAPLSADIRILALGNALFLASTTVVLITTESEPVFATDALLSSTTKSAADVFVSPEPNGLVPALPPPPPHATSMVAATHALSHR